MKLWLARRAAAVERWIDRVRRPKDGEAVIEPYLGYATPDALIVRGRVLRPKRAKELNVDQSRWRNVRDMVRLFFTDEVADVLVRASPHGPEVRSDEEGYFTLSVPRLPDLAGQVEVPVALEESVPVPLPVLVPSGDAWCGVISDIDDTMMETGAYSLRRNLWTTLTGNAGTRLVFPDAVTLMERLTQGGNPVFYVSSSPWNLHGFLAEVFARHGLVRGPMFLRDYGISETQLITGTHGDHKGSAIDTILAANPGLRFVLIGDTGQHDCHVYLAAVKRHPERIERVIFRTPGGGIDADDQAQIDAIRALGVPVYAGSDYAGALEEFHHRAR